MKPQEHGVPLTGWVSPVLASPANPFAAFANAVYKTMVIAGLELRKLRNDPTELVMRAVQPSLWLLIFGQVFTRVRAIPTGQLRYLDFMTPGILAQSVLFIAIFHGIAIIWERDWAFSTNSWPVLRRAPRWYWERRSRRACAARSRGYSSICSRLRWESASIGIR